MRTMIVFCGGLYISSHDLPVGGWLFLLLFLVAFLGDMADVKKIFK